MVKRIITFDSESKAADELRAQILNAAEEAISSRNLFKIGLSGGSLIGLLAKIFSKISIDFSKWKFFFCDERVVPFDNADSTFGAYQKAFADIAGITDEQFVAIDPELSAEEAAKDYIKKLSIYFPPNDIPRFDLLLLGMGPDGHTCSLFPGHPLVQETAVWVAPITDSPKPPPCRITLTFPVINNTRLAIFVATGESKAPMIKKILQDGEPLPAQLVQPTKGDVIWLLDKAAASHSTGLATES